MSSKLEQNVETILTEVQQISPLREEIKDLKEKIEPLQVACAVSEEKWTAHQRTHSILRAIGMLALASILTIVGFMIEGSITDAKIAAAKTAVGAP